MLGERQKSLWDLLVEGESEAQCADRRGAETRPAKRETESPARMCQLMEKIVSGENMRRALKRVRSNRGAPGVDGMTVDALGSRLAEHWPRRREQLLAGNFRPRPVKPALILKSDGGHRMLGLLTAVARLIEQAVLQVLQHAEGAETLGGAGSGTDALHAECVVGPHSRHPARASRRLAALIRLLPDAEHLGVSGQLDTAPTARLPVETVEVRNGPHRRTARPTTKPRPRRHRCRDPSLMGR